MERCNREGKESFMPNLTPEQEAREKIDQMLVDASWIVQNNADDIWHKRINTKIQKYKSGRAFRHSFLSLIQ